MTISGTILKSIRDMFMIYECQIKTNKILNMNRIKGE